MGMMMFFQLLAGSPAFFLAAFGLWVCYRHRHLSPWMWCLMAGLAGILSKTGFHALFLLLAVGQEFGLDAEALGGEMLQGGFLGLILSGVAGWLGECALLLGLPMVIRDLTSQFQLWKELQAGNPGGESD